MIPTHSIAPATWHSDTEADAAGHRPAQPEQPEQPSPARTPASKSRSLPLPTFAMDDARSKAFKAGVRDIGKAHLALQNLHTANIVNPVARMPDEKSELLSGEALAALPDRLPNTEYRIKQGAVHGVEIRLLFGYRRGEIVDARTAWPEAPAGAHAEPSRSASTPHRAERGIPPAVEITFFPAFQSTEASANTSAAGTRAPVSPRSGMSRDASPMSRQGDRGRVLKDRLAELAAKPASFVSTSGHTTPLEAFRPRAPGMSLFLHGERLRAESPASISGRSDAGSVMTLHSIEGALGEDARRIICGTEFAKTLEGMLEPHYPYLNAAIRGGGSSRPRNETRGESLHRRHILTEQHLFMYATLDAVMQALTELGVNPAGPIHLQLQDIGHDIDVLMSNAFANAIRYCEASTQAAHGPFGPYYARIGRFAETSAPQDRIYKNLDFNAHETMELLHAGFQRVPGFQDLPAHERWRFIVDPAKIHALPEQHPLLAFLCDYDKAYAVKIARAIPIVMDKDKPVSLDLIQDVHTVAAAGSTAFESRSTILAGFVESEIAFIRHEGLHYTEAGKAELHAFRRHIDALRQEFLQAHPEMEDFMTNSRITIAENARTQSLEYRRGPMPAAFLEFCIERWLREMNEVLADSKASADDKKRAAIRFCMQGEHLHPFMDGNGRVFEILLPMRLFHDIDGTLRMLDYPRKMDGHAVEEVFVEFEKAAARTEALKRSAASPGIMDLQRAEARGARSEGDVFGIGGHHGDDTVAEDARRSDFLEIEGMYRPGDVE